MIRPKHYWMGRTSFVLLLRSTELSAGVDPARFNYSFFNPY